MASLSLCLLSFLFLYFFVNVASTPEIYTLSLHDALPIYRDVLDVEKALPCRRSVVPIEASRRDRRVRQPVHRDVLEDIVSREAFALSVEDARDQRVTARIVVEYPRCQADG